MKIAKIDKNFEIKTNIDRADIVFYDSEHEPFNVYGMFKENGKYRRIPQCVADNISEGAKFLHSNTAGGRVKFATDSKYVVISAKMSGIGKMPHFALTGSAGFDLYVGKDYKYTFVPKFETDNELNGIVEFETREMREITINFPLYSDVENLYIGLQCDATVKKAKPYVNKLPVVYYGSSTTQGGCASRPGMSYQSIVSRTFNCDFVNLGLSGNAKAQDAIVEYIKTFEMCLFVYDYDHNAPTVEYLEKTHGWMFEEVRKTHPHIPIIIMSRAKNQLNDEERSRLEIIKRTYNDAKLSGDNNVYLLDGPMLTELCKDEGTVDGVHPTDYGFVSIAKALCECIEKNKLDKCF